MLSVFSVYWGDKYDPSYVYALRDMVAKHLHTPHKFFCITSAELPDINTIEPAVDWPGWWQKLQLWRLNYGPSLYFDLDVVITGPLDYLLPFTQHAIAAPANWAQSGHGGIQSSVLVWNGNNPHPYFLAKQQWPEISERLWGDQEFLTEVYGDNYVKLPRIYSYKYHCMGKPLPKDCSVVCFHGKPDPHEVNEAWINTQQYIRTPR